jgi:ubiquinone/menaquinone biosynthesis C-methylase UbiE
MRPDDHPHKRAGGTRVSSQVGRASSRTASRTSPSIAWTGRLTLPVRMMVTASNLLSWVSGAATNGDAMKAHVRLGYEGAASDDVLRYDELGNAHYTRIAQALLERVELRGQRVLDVGCGTGIALLLALNKGAAAVTGADFSARMLRECRGKAIAAGQPSPQVSLHQGDAEALPFAANTFDVVVCSMVLGLVPHQARLTAELARVVRPGGTLALATHGPDYYWEAIDAAFRAVPKRYVMGYRLEMWPRGEAIVRRMLHHAGLPHLETQRITWRDTFASGGGLYDFFAATSSSWWLNTMPPGKIAAVAQRMRRGFERRGVTQLTMDVVLAHGVKPA